MFVGGRRGGSFGGGSSRSSRNSSRDLIQNVAINDGLKKFNAFAEKITRPDEYDIFRQLYEECVSKWGVDDNELKCGYYKLKMDFLCSGNKNTKDAEKKTEPDKCDIYKLYYGACVRKRGVDAEEFYCGFYKEKMAFYCSGQKDTKKADVSPSNRVESTSMLSSNTLVRDGAIVDGLETFNDFAKKKMRPNECDIIRQQREECVSKGGAGADDRKELASFGSKKTTKSADASPSIFECLCLIP